MYNIFNREVTVESVTKEITKATAIFYESLIKLERAEENIADAQFILDEKAIEIAKTQKLFTAISKGNQKTISNIKNILN